MIESGTQLQGRFLIEGRIGEGVMGAVYLAVDQKFGSRVAIKETFYGDAELAEAFEREARLLNGLHHPIFPHVSDHFSENGGHFLVMEYIEGEDMSTLLKRGEVFSVEEVMGWTLDLLDGLDYLHSQDPPIIHRDIKPNNLKLTSRGNIVLLDIGMAKETSGTTLGMKSVFGYSRRYSPLEQIEGTGTDHRSDIFSLGATVFHLLTGKPPVDVLARASAIVSGKIDPLESADALRPDVPESVAAIINSALALNPDHRFATARAMWRALEYALGLDLVREDAAPRAGNSRPAVIGGGGEFAALDAYRNGGEIDAPHSEEDVFTTAAVSNLPEQGSDTVPDNPDAINFGDVDPESAHQVTPLENDGPPLDRAVIHLESVDVEDNDQHEASPEGADIASEKVEIPVAAAVPAPTTRPGINRRLGSTGVLWLTLLLALLSGLVVFGVFGTSSDAPAVQESQPEPAAEEQPPAEQETTAVVETNPEEPAVPEEPENDPPSGDVASADEPQADNEEDQPMFETDEPEADAEPAAPVRARPGRENRDERLDDDSESRRNDTRRSAPSPVRRAPQRQQVRRSRAERPRIVDVFEEPSVVSIETVLTGVPYERPRRWRDLWEDDDELRPRRNRRGRRDRPPFPLDRKSTRLNSSHLVISYAVFC